MPPNTILFPQVRSNVISTYAKDISLVDPRDKDTPDRVVARNPNLIRLTGKHPFNAEPPLSLLDESGFITPNDLHFVRNHGPVAHCEFAAHELEICGEINKPCVITMDDLLALPSITFPVTMACAGNRRKEVNMQRQTIGFSWGAAGVSTARWTGVPLNAVLNVYAGGLNRKANYVCFEGCDNTSKGPYGTCITSQRAMNDVYDVILAYKMNGEWLSPDHGFPLRVIVPGCIGGRSVKWLTKISVSEELSPNLYHYYDNKVFPSHVDKEMADSEKWWYKPDYTLYDLNINSVILSPDHGASLPLDKALADSSFHFRGYAYSGGNRKVTRVELSFDGGDTWELTELQHPEEDESSEQTKNYDVGYKRIRHWCWSLWKYTINPSRLLRCQEICVRAWDEAQNTQPGNFSWNLMGMLNNSWYRIKVDIVETADGTSFQFRHPTIAGSEKGGWMDALQLDQTKQPSTDTKASLPSNIKTLTLEDVAKHSTEDDCWIAIRNKVYDCTPFMKLHPGGVDSIVLAAGQDCTEDFDAIHSTAAHDMLEKYIIGTIATRPLQATVAVTPADAPSSQFLDPRVWKTITLDKKEYITKDICVLRFLLPSLESDPGLPIGKHVYLRGSSKGNMMMRAYTPSLCAKGFLEFIIKVYRPNNRYVQGGLFSQYLDELSIGDSIETKGPLGSFEYLGHGRYMHSKRKEKPAYTKDIGMICAGTGITPIWQILKAISEEARHNDYAATRISLIYGNRHEEDIILRRELQEIQRNLGPSNFSMRLILSKSSDAWQQGKGRINREEIRAHLFPFNDFEKENSIVLLCGTDAMIRDTFNPVLEEMFDPDFMERNVFVF